MPEARNCEATIATGSEDSTIIIWQPAKESGGDRRKFEARNIFVGMHHIFIAVTVAKYGNYCNICCYCRCPMLKPREVCLIMIVVPGSFNFASLS